MDDLLTILAAGIVVIIFLLTLWPRRSRPRCPECGSDRIGKQQSAAGMRTYEYHTDDAAGGYTSVQMQYTVTYRCNDCRAQWAGTETETK